MLLLPGSLNNWNSNGLILAVGLGPLGPFIWAWVHSGPGHCVFRIGSFQYFAGWGHLICLTLRQFDHDSDWEHLVILGSGTFKYFQIGSIERFSDWQRFIFFRIGIALGAFNLFYHFVL